jgi:hypothetical protein
VIAVELLPDFNCNSCPDALKPERGCNSDSPIPYEFDGEEVRRCPRRVILEDREGFYPAVFGHYRAYKAGFLPEPGGTGDQSAFLMGCMHIMSSAMAEVQQAQMDEARENNARANSRGRME